MTLNIDVKLANIALHGIQLYVGKNGLDVIRSTSELTEHTFRATAHCLSIRLATRMPDYNDQLLSWMARGHSDKSAWEWRVAGWYACEELPLYYMSQDMIERLTSVQMQLLSTRNNK